MKTVEIVNAMKNHIDDLDDESTNLHLAPPAGSIHPIGGLFHPMHPRSSSSQRQVLKVTWEEEKRIHHDNDKRSDLIHSFYDIDWLARCRYDTIALERKSEQQRITKDIALGSKNCKIAIKCIEYSNLMNDANDNHETAQACSKEHETDLKRY